MVFLFAFEPLFKMSAASGKKKKKKDEGKISLMKHLLCLRLYQIAMYLFNRTRVDGAEATCKSEKGKQTIKVHLILCDSARLPSGRII